MKKKPTPDRRVPSQARSLERVERILDAAAFVFAEVGFEAATTEGIAARADTSIGSLYQFFPNKRALLYAIAQRYAERVSELFDRVEAEVLAGGQPFGALLRAAIDALVAFHAEEPGFRAIVRNWSSHEFAEFDEAANAHRAAPRQARAPAAEGAPPRRGERHRRDRVRHAHLGLASQGQARPADRRGDEGHAGALAGSLRLSW